MKKLAAVGYLTLFRDFKLAPMINTYIDLLVVIKFKRSESVTYVSVISKIIKQYFDIKLSKGLLHRNLLWNSADKLHLM